ncbi:MAG: hypothetical protein ACP5QG_07595 [candidate division WOR-3 bacterium]
MNNTKKAKHMGMLVAGICAAIGSSAAGVGLNLAAEPGFVGAYGTSGLGINLGAGLKMGKADIVILSPDVLIFDSQHTPLV